MKRLVPTVISSAWQGNKQFIVVVFELPGNSTAIVSTFNPNSGKYEEVQRWTNSNAEAIYPSWTMGPNKANFVEVTLA